MKSEGRSAVDGGSEAPAAGAWRYRTDDKKLCKQQLVGASMQMRDMWTRCSREVMMDTEARACRKLRS